MLYCYFLYSAAESEIPAKLPLHASAAAKAELFRERYTILHQVILLFGSVKWQFIYVKYSSNK